MVESTDTKGLGPFAERRESLNLSFRTSYKARVKAGL